MAILTFEVKGQTLTVKSSIGKIVENSSKYLDYVVVTNDPEWDKLAIKLILTYNGGSGIAETAYGFIPNDYIKAPGIQVSIVGYDTTTKKQIPTNPVFINISPSGEIDANEVGGNTLPDFTEAEIQLEAFTKLQKTVGDDTKGLVKDVHDLQNNKVDNTVFETHVNNKADSVLNNIADNNKYPSTKATYQYAVGREVSILESLILRKNKIYWDNNDPKWTINSSQNHVLLPITEDLWGKLVSLQGHAKNNGEIAFLKISDINTIDYNAAPPYASEDEKLYSFGNGAVRAYQIPENTTHIYVYMYSANMTEEHLPKSLIINGIDYCLGTANNIQAIQNSLNTHISNMVEDFEGNTDSNDQYPTVKAIVDYINQSEHITRLTENDTYVWDLPPGIYTFTATNTTQKLCLTSGKVFTCDEGAFLIVGGENYSGNLPSSSNITSFKKSIIFLRTINHAAAQIMAGVSTVTYTTAEDGKVTYTAEWDGGIIESQDNKVNVIDESVTNDQYSSAKATYNYVENKTNKISSNSANALKNIVTNKNLVEISDISPLEHELKVSTGMGMSVTAYCRGKNLFGLEGRTQVTDFNSEAHTFTGKGIFTGVTANNFYGPNRVTFEYDNKTEEIKFSSTNEWYGLGIDIEVQPRASYSISVEDLTENFTISVSFYTASGVFMNKSLTSLITNQTKTHTFTTPDNAKWAIIVLIPKSGTENQTGIFKKVQVEKNTTATAFEKYVIPQIGVSNASTGVISGFKSIYPTTIIDVNLDNVLVTCEYNRDINKAYDELQSNYNKLKTAIEKLGGTIE